ncbi:MAG TPA: hypothetical protein VMH33_00730 [Solirubrobacterales bacterium]|nr:hypothetical protein [Solirubrobacterales bacterium]
MRRRAHRLLAAAALIGVLALVVAVGASGFGESVVPRGHGLADDCLGGASLARGSKTTVDWVVWCGPAKGRARIKVEAPKQASPAHVYSRARMIGAAPGDGLDCRFGRVTSCRLEKNGPITVRGSFTVSQGACAGRTLVQIPTTSWDQGEAFFKEAEGCPGSKSPRVPSVARIARFFEEEELEPTLRGDHAALVRRAKQVRRAWIAESPTERWSAVAWEAPVDAATAEELALRMRMNQQAATAIPNWVHEHRLGSTYAGWYSAEGKIFVGFTREPEAMLGRLKSNVSFVAPARVTLFPVPPLYSEGHLNKVMNEVLDATEDIDEEKYGITDIGVEIQDNKVGVGAIHVAATRRLLVELMGPEAPIEVVKGAYMVLV